MTDVRDQSSPGSDSGYSAEACSETGIENALERLRMDEFTPDQLLDGEDSVSTASSGEPDTDSVNSQDGDPSKQQLDIWRDDPRKVEGGKEKKKKKSLLQKIIAKEKVHKHLPVIDFTSVTVNSLPQMFLAKYLGKRPTKALHGVKHTRCHVDDMVKAATKLPSGTELPLVVLQVTKKGLDINEHKRNKNKDFEGGLIPIEFISYGVQDVKFFRIFSLIMVHQMSSRRRDCECHAWACDSPLSARRLALSISLAFQEFSKSVKDLKGSVFKVDLRTPQAAVKDLEKTDECDA